MIITEIIHNLEKLRDVYGDIAVLLLAKSGSCVSTMQIDSIDFMQDIRLKNMNAVYVRSDGLDLMFEEEKLRVFKRS